MSAGLAPLTRPVGPPPPARGPFVQAIPADPAAVDPPRGAGLPTSVAAAFVQGYARWTSAGAEGLAQGARDWRARPLAYDQNSAAERAEALAFAAAAVRLVLGLTPYDTQVLAAWRMLDGALVEMAAGEGKTVATAMAAAAAALNREPVHVLTANDYLVVRDQTTMAPVFTLLGLRSAAIPASLARERRAAAYRHDIVYLTGRELVVDCLKDHVALRGDRDPRVLRARQIDGVPTPGEPVVPGLHLAIVDEADSLLLDEACSPFVLAAQGPAPRVDALAAARELAATLTPEDFQLLPERREARLADRGLRRIEAATHSASPLWPARHAQELVAAALVAEHLMQRDRDYTVVDGKVGLIDVVTGGLAPSRQWTGPLQALVELKEGVVPSVPSATAARITYQRFFARYERLGGTSGTLREAAGELRALYGCRVERVPLARPSRARWLGTSCHVDAAARARAVVARVRACIAEGRPVLVGTGSGAASQALSEALAAAGIVHQVLNAAQDMDEAVRIAHAGRAGAVTVATHIAGLGTDIRLDAAARDAGGLHVILALANRARRIDRQLLGRGARHGDPGSAERMLALDDEVLAVWPAALRRACTAMADADGHLPGFVGRALLAPAQRRGEWQDRLLRRDLRIADDPLADHFRRGGRTE